MTSMLSSSDIGVRPSEVRIPDIDRLVRHSTDLSATAMALTDSWGQAMFVLDRTTVTELFAALGFRDEVAERVYDAVRAVGYVYRTHRSADGTSITDPEVTWHAMDATCLTLRGVTDLAHAFDEIDDAAAAAALRDNRDLFETLMGAVPAYTANLMFSPQVAATVVATLGGHVTAAAIHDLATSMGRSSTLDLDGRQGVSTQFIRSMTLTLSAVV